MVNYIHIYAYISIFISLNSQTDGLFGHGLLNTTPVAPRPTATALERGDGGAPAACGTCHAASADDQAGVAEAGGSPVSQQS